MINILNQTVLLFYIFICIQLRYLQSYYPFILYQLLYFISQEIKLIGVYPPIEKMEGPLHILVNCEKLSLSTNLITQIQNLQVLKNLRVLSLGRNLIKSLQVILRLYIQICKRCSTKLIPLICRYVCRDCSSYLLFLLCLNVCFSQTVHIQQFLMFMVYNFFYIRTTYNN